MARKSSLEPWYFNAERLETLLGTSEAHEYAQSAQGASGRVYRFSPQGTAIQSLVRLAYDRISDGEIPTLTRLINESKVRVGALFYIFQNFYGSGLSKFRRGEIPRGAVAHVRNYITSFPKTHKLEVTYAPQRLIGTTAWERLSRQSRLFILGIVHDVHKGMPVTIEARPIVIGDLMDTAGGQVGILANYGEIHPTQIEQFKKIENQMQRTPALAPLKDISETTIKNYLAEIIGERAVSKDWGGERSDLFTSNLKVNGQWMSAAFLLKGPAKFHKLFPADLGRRGDQISRLFSEPAQLLILQHCHSIDSSVRNQMKAYANQIGNLRYYSILDGYDTMRLLKSYGKL